GIQFLFWTVSGLYFSWSDIDDIHGDFQHKQPPLLSASFNLVSPSTAIEKLPVKVDSIKQIQVISILQKPFYSIVYYSGNNIQTILADAVSCNIRTKIQKEEAMKIAAESFNGEPAIKQVQYITSVGKHGEYREKPLPAWKITFNYPTNTNVYVASATGKVETFRNEKWRTFDLLWMFHTMDYEGRIILIIGC
ncbi:MAG: PepSY domain-containing protein, partial [Segetibacter sp.]